MISPNEIKNRALAFSKEWERDYNEDAEAKSFWDGFFDVFGVSRKRVASFEYPVKKLANKQGYIQFPNSSLADLYDPNTMPPDLVEAHNDLDKAVDACYGRKFQNKEERIEFLFELYKKYNK